MLSKNRYDMSRLNRQNTFIDNDCIYENSFENDFYEKIDWEPFPMKFEIDEKELRTLKQVFSSYMSPTDHLISFEELFHDLEQIDLKTKNPMLYEILKRMTDFEEMKQDRVSFDTFISLIRRALDMRKTKQ